MQTNRLRHHTCDWTQNLRALPTTRTRQLAQRSDTVTAKPGRRTTRKTSSTRTTFEGAFMHLASCKLQQSHHLQHIAFDDQGSWKILKAYDCERSAALLRMATAIACANTRSNSMHLSLDATSPSPRHNAREPLARQVKCGDAQVNHGQLRTWHWTQRLKRLPRTRARKSPHKSLMGTSTEITWDSAPVTERNFKATGGTQIFSLPASIMLQQL